MSWEDPLPQARRAFRRGSRSFSAAALLFDGATRRDVTLLYAWCRHCDDVIDGQVLGHGRPQAASLTALAVLEAQTRQAFGPEPMTDPAFAALQSVALRRGIPEALALGHLDGFRMDVESRHYETIGDTLDYCYHIAGVVGLMMAHVMGVREPATLGRACDLGIAFQLTNIARDITEDAANGRVYLPAEWLREAGLTPVDLACGRSLPALATVASRLLGVADQYYASAELGIAALPWRSAWAVATARAVYRDIGTQVLRRGADAWRSRASTSGGRKLLLTMRSLAGLTLRPAPMLDG
jgi:phytoene synthase